MTTQTTLELSPAPPGPLGRQADAPDASGFEIGWDHARHGLAPPPELLVESTTIGQGWRAARAVFGRRTLPVQQATRQWLALRTLAWREGIAFEGQQLTPHYLAQLRVTHCPVLRTPLGGAPGQPDAAVFERLNPQAAWAAGNVVMMSQRAAQARTGVHLLEAMRRARRAERAGEAVEGLDAGAWWRLASLRACATPLPFHEAARVPLAALPPNRVRLLNPAQGLQALVTLQFTTPGWSARTRALAALLPEHTVRHDFNLFVGTLAPRVLEAGPDTARLRRALEDAWLQERVQRRWQHFVLSLGEAATAALLERATADGLTAVRTVNHLPEQATDGWALGERGRAPRTWRSRLSTLRMRPQAGMVRPTTC